MWMRVLGMSGKRGYWLGQDREYLRSHWLTIIILEKLINNVFLLFPKRCLWRPIVSIYGPVVICFALVSYITVVFWNNLLNEGTRQSFFFINVRLSRLHIVKNIYLQNECIFSFGAWQKEFRHSTTARKYTHVTFIRTVYSRPLWIMQKCVCWYGFAQKSTQTRVRAHIPTNVHALLHT